MTRTLVSDNSPFEPTIGFSRAVRVGNIIAVSGTASIGPDGKTFAPGDLKFGDIGLLDLSLLARMEKTRFAGQMQG